MTGIEKRRRRIVQTRQTADMLCTAHAGLRDRYRRRALLLDVAILVLSVFLVAQTFADPLVKGKLNLFGLDLGVWLGLLATSVFALSVVQLRVNWKATTEAHSRSFSLYAEAKRELGYLLDSESIDEEAASRIHARYDLAADLGTTISEAEFLRQKQRHKVKLFISNYLDDHPGASITLIRLKLFLRDTFGWNVLDSSN